MMKTADEETWEAEYWDDILKEFGPEEYIKLRYMGEGVTRVAQRGSNGSS